MPRPAPSLASLTTDARHAHYQARERLLSLQRDSGAWEGEMVWNTATLSQYVIARHLLCRPVPPAERGLIIRHYSRTRTGAGWPMHPAATSESLYCTALGYVALRLLGLPPDHALCRPARQWLTAQPDGVIAIATWGKFWLGLLGLYDHRAMHPVLPELFLLPRWFPLHPDRLYCHTRSIAQAMAFLYGTQFTGPADDVTDALRTELFSRPTRPADRHRIGGDASMPATVPLRLVQRVQYWYEGHHWLRLRRRALDRCHRRVRHEHGVTDRIGLSPVNGLLDILVLAAHGAPDKEIERSLAAFDYWRWTDPDSGTRYAGARSHTWDTSFAVEALLADGVPSTGTADAVIRATRFLQAAQVAEEVPTPPTTGRSPALGGWCFSEGGHRWAVSDCTAEAVGALFTSAKLTGGLPPGCDTSAAASFLLARQNRDGGFGTYEPRRGPRFLERLNPAEMFTRCMVEDSYTECTGSAAVALSLLRDHGDVALRAACTRALGQARAFLLRTQSSDGSWPAAWGVNRIYGTLFAARGLLATGPPRNHPSFVKAAWWLESIQLPDGGWAEHSSGCLTNEYVPGHVSQPVSTAWALLTLLPLSGGQNRSVLSGIDWLCRHQRPNGTWQQSAATGVFFGTAMLDYRLYREYFPLWALGRWLTTQTKSPSPHPFALPAYPRPSGAAHEH
ncbi:hypothetical protein [Streptomyces sparsus]